MFCVWVALKYFTQGETGQNHPRGLFDKAESTRGKGEAQAAKILESAADSGKTSNKQREDTSQEVVGEQEHVRSKQSVREWTISMLERLLNFLKNGRERISPV